MTCKYRSIIGGVLLVAVVAGGVVYVQTRAASKGSGASAAKETDLDLRTAVPGGGYTNRLAEASSPYLRLHADNPVDWYPWGEEAFKKAREENKPIFLSVGYSTCHWCHVMERKSFMDPEIAKIMNENFVNVKVDREERPDVDRIYMTFVRATTGSGGWPMSVWLTPDLKPFFGGTYFPPEGKYGRPGFKDILKEIDGRWENNRQQILDSSEKVTQQLRAYAESLGAKQVKLSANVLDQLYQQLEGQYDPKHGGFGKAPKFPQVANFNFLLRYYDRTGKDKALEMTLDTLREMAKGGIRDHLGGGFHRYSVDGRWHVPHFEKMLYNQAQLTWAYLEAYQITDERFYANVARDILRYVQRDMTGEHDAFYSAEGADSPRPQSPSEHAEGAFYVWKYGDIVSILGKEEASIFNYYYGVEKNGNVQRDPHGEFDNRNVLYVVHSVEETAEKYGKSEEKVRNILETARKNLFKVRAARPRPNLDDKVLTAWNGLMISAFARAYQVLGDDAYLEDAERAAAFIKEELYQAGDATLLRRYREGNVGIDAKASDYAYLIQGLLDLYEAGFDPDYLRWAVKLQKAQDTLFWDEKNGGYFSTSGESRALLFRMKEPQDSAQPSANSVAARNLLRLDQMTDNPDYRKRAQGVFKTFSGRLKKMPSSLPQMLASYMFYIGTPKQVILAGSREAKKTEAMLEAVHKRFIPNKILLVVNAETRSTLKEYLPFVENLTQKDGAPTAYICENYVCQRPTSDLKTMVSLLEGKSMENAEEPTKLN